MILQWLNQAVVILALPVILSGCASAVLLHAAADGDTQLVATQLAKGTNPNSTVPVVGTPAIVLASAEGHLDIVRTLIAGGADVNAEDVAGWTALHAAAKNGRKEVVSFLLEHGATIKPAKWYNPSPLYVAERRGWPEILEMLKAETQVRRTTSASKASGDLVIE